MDESENRLTRERTKTPARISERLADNPWVWRLASLGYAAKGLLYVIVGSTAGLAAINVGGRVRGMQGALILLIAQPLGQLVVAIVAVGLGGFIIRRFVQVFVPPTIGVPPKKITRILRRAGYALSGLAHLGIALTALGLILGVSSLGSDAQLTRRGWQALLLTRNPLDGWLVLLAGFVVIGVAIFYFYMAVSRRFSVDLQTQRMSRRAEKAVFACGIAGYAGRGIAFLVGGAFLVYAGWFGEKAESGSYSEMFGILEAQPFGRWILVIIAAGLTAYGLYLLLAARYLRLIAAW